MCQEEEVGCAKWQQPYSLLSYFLTVLSSGRLSLFLSHPTTFPSFLCVENLSRLSGVLSVSNKCIVSNSVVCIFVS